jgi:hypothetical protein
VARIKIKIKVAACLATLVEEKEGVGRKQEAIDCT